jgi:hypothetical protein
MRYSVPSYKASGPSYNRATSLDFLTSACGEICRGFGVMASTVCWIDAPCRIDVGPGVAKVEILAK